MAVPGHRLKAEEERHPPAEAIPLRWVFALAAVVALGAVGTVVFEIVRQRNLNRAQYGFTAALLCFALSTISGLLFASKVRLRATLGVFSATIIGPAALWLIALMVIVKIIPPPDIGVTPEELRRLTALIEKLDRSAGWSSFEDWKGNLGPLRSVFEGDEETNLKHLLNGAFIVGRDQSKLSKPTIETLFVYPPIDQSAAAPKRIAYKFQRIAGLAKTGKEVVYTTAAPTGSDGSAQSAFFVRGIHGRISTAKVLQGPSGEWQTARSSGDFDGLLVARYEDRADLPGDWMQVHTPKYVAEDETATIVVGFAAPQAMPVDRTVLWEMRPAVLSPTSTIPLLFKSRSDALAASPPFSNPFQAWLDDLQKFASETGTDQGSEASRKLLRVFAQEITTASGPAIQKIAWRNILAGPDFHTVAFDLANHSNPVVVTFQWR